MTSRAIPLSVRREFEKQESGQVPLIFLTITHPAIEEQIRVVSDVKDYVFGGLTYTGFPFDIVLPSDNEGPPSATLSIQNVDRVIGDTLRRVSDPARLSIVIVSSADFDLTAEPRTEISTAPEIYRYDHGFLVDVDIDVMTVSGTIRGWDYRSELWPGLRATQDMCPGLFR